ncbi:MAG: radical SAM family heme chaperone HemW [Lachnospiraceae bacterium]|nr:radical SAM family heme chaperone HemW [Lachnospiraceae bacterium]
MMNNLSLYIHIPFCIRKCHYCDFLSAPCDEETRQKYVDALCREIIQRAEEFQNRKVDTIFFGGGTPSVLSAEQMEQIVSTIRRHFQILSDAEISMEMNPGTVNKEKLETYKKLGINRLSIGLQSADNEELKILGRIHTWENFLQTWEMVREEGFFNVNIDLMSALPGQTLESYGETLRKVLALKPEHISAYSLIIEEGTQFYKWFGEEYEGQSEQVVQGNATDMNEALSIRKSKALPDEITDRKMYELTKTLLEEQGYYRYEISNYALKGYECKHNIGYWKRKEYLGLGLGAASLISDIRSTNITDLQTYLEVGNQKEETKLSATDQMEEFMFLGLRMMEGISPTEFEEQFGQSLQEVYGTQIAKLEKQGLLEFCRETQRYALTLQGIDVSNQVFVEFIQ